MDQAISVLCIDDEEMFGKNIKAFLEDEDFIVELAFSGNEGIDLTRKIKPDVVLCDVRMPLINGLEVLEVIKNEFPTTPVIMISGAGKMNDVIEALRLGAWDYIEKPIMDMNILVLAIQNAFERARILRENIQYKNNLELMLEQRTNQLLKTEREAAFSQVIQGIVHNMKSPLGVLLNTQDVVKVILANLEEKIDMENNKIVQVVNSLRNLLNNNHKAALKLSDMVKSLMAKGSRDKKEEIQKYDLNKLINEEYLFLTSNSLVGRKIRTEFVNSPKQLPVKTVSSEIAQVFSNLFKNSQDALHNQKEARISVKCGETADMAWFSISDNGPGISEEIADKVFDPFFTTKTKNSTNDRTEPEGTGLGLHFCKETIESYGGEIVMNTSGGEGTEFVVYLPIS